MNGTGGYSFIYTNPRERMGLNIFKPGGSVYIRTLFEYYVPEQPRSKIDQNTAAQFTNIISVRLKVVPSPRHDGM